MITTKSPVFKLRPRSSASQDVEPTGSCVVLLSWLDDLVNTLDLLCSAYGRTDWLPTIALSLPFPMLPWELIMSSDTSIKILNSGETAFRQLTLCRLKVSRCSVAHDHGRLRKFLGYWH